MSRTFLTALAVALATAADGQAKLIGGGGGGPTAAGGTVPAPSGGAGNGVFLGALLVVAIAVVLVRRPHAHRR